MKLTVVRHGQTTENARKILMRQGHGRLSKLGKVQVKALGKELQTQKFDFIYCSDLKRCKETLKAIAKFHKHIPVVFTEQLRERAMGVYEGKPRTELDKKFRAYTGRPMDFKPQGGESVREQKLRVANFLKYLKRNHLGDKILLITHGGVIRCVVSILQKIPISKLFRSVVFENTGICEYQIFGNKIKVLRFNDSKHL